MNLTIETYKSVGPIKFGMTIEAVREAVGLPVSTFMKSSSELIPTDAFDYIGAYVYYKSSGVCRAVEMAAPADPTLYGMSFIGKPFSEARAWIESLDPDIAVDGSGLTSFKYGIGLYAPFAGKEPDEPVEAVIAFERGYYEGTTDEAGI